MSAYTINGYDLTLEKVSAIMSDAAPEVSIAPEAAAECIETRKQIDRWLEEGAPAIYGINTGLGALKDVPVPADKHTEWNKTLPYPHSAGFGQFLPTEVTRLALLLRANILCRAFSAPRTELIERILSLVNAGIAPAVYAEGSTGLSDLAPMAQCIMVVAGLPEGRAFYQGQLMSAGEACRKAGLPESFDLHCKEVLMQMNGSTMSQAISLTAFFRCKKLFEKVCAGSSSVGTGPAAKHQACRETLDFVAAILEQENNITCDNPLLFKTEDGTYEAVMGCNCSNTQVGYAMDLLSVWIAELAQGLEAATTLSDAQRQTCNQLRMMTMQVSADSIPTKGGQEDHVEFSYTAAMKAAKGSALLERLLA